MLFLLITLAVPSLPPGGLIYDALNVPETDYLVLGVGATKLIVAIFNGVVYGMIVWLVYSLTLGRKKKAVSGEGGKAAP